MIESSDLPPGGRPPQNGHEAPLATAGYEGGASEPIGLAERMVSVITNPRRAFTGLSGRVSPWVVIIPILVWGVTNGIAAEILAPFIREARIGMVEHMEMLPESQREELLERFEEPPPEPHVRLLNQLPALAGSALFLFIVPALIFWLVFAHIMGSKSSYGSVLAVLALAALVSVPRALVTVPLQLLKGSVDVRTSLALLSPEGPYSLTTFILNRFDIFTIWHLVLLVTGLAMVTGATAKKTGVLLVSFWLIVQLALIGFKATPLGQFMPAY